jgi:hypothetical protein
MAKAQAVEFLSHDRDRTSCQRVLYGGELRR